MPLISVLITTYNREQFVSEAIESVLQSTFQDFELIVVDDASVDKTVSVIRNYTDKDSRIKLYINEVNVGDYPNRIKAVQYATGDYIKFVDADDKIYPWTLCAFVSAIKKFPEAALVISPTSDLINGEFPFLLKPKESLRFHFFKAGILDGGPTCTMFKKSSYNTVGGFSNERWISDIKLWLTIASKYEVVIVNQGLVYWRQHTGQEINSEKKYRELFQKTYNNFFIDFIISTDNNLLTIDEKKKILNSVNKSLLKKFFEKCSKYFLSFSQGL